MFETSDLTRPAAGEQTLLFTLDTAERQLQEALALAQAGLESYQRALGALAELRTTAGQGTAAGRDDVRPLLAGEECCDAVILDQLECNRLIRIQASRPVDPSLDGLTSREIDVLRLIATGHSNKQIAMTLGLSVRTIERHITNLYGKIDAQNKADATVYALRHHLA